MAQVYKVTLVKSPIGALPKHKACVKGLGLKRMNHTVVRAQTPENKGMITKIRHLLKVEESTDAS